MCRAGVCSYYLSEGQTDKRREKKILADAITFKLPDSKKLAGVAACDMCSSASAPPPKGVFSQLRHATHRRLTPRRAGGNEQDRKSWPIRKLKKKSALTVHPDGKWELHGQPLFIGPECSICLEEVSCRHCAPNWTCCVCTLP
jgi:hypothetical protein